MDSDGWSEYERMKRRCDSLTAELQVVRDELARVRKNHLRRMLDSLHPALDRAPWIRASCETDYDRQKYRRRERMGKLCTAIRAALANNAKDGT